MKQVAKDVDTGFILKNIAKGSVIIPKNTARKQEIKIVGIGKGLETKVNVNFGTSTLYSNIEEYIQKQKLQQNMEQIQ